ncbi:hypothetical protein BC833DRAFT_624119 [Globomyces pollinis-pini]|nr:hypothetical protein BC833DRAFT_624119 [Globomyces pollinis-pini]
MVRYVILFCWNLLPAIIVPMSLGLRIHREHSILAIIKNILKLDRVYNWSMVAHMLIIIGYILNANLANTYLYGDDKVDFLMRNVQRTFLGTHEILATVSLGRLRFILPRIIQAFEQSKLESKKSTLGAALTFVKNLHGYISEIFQWSSKGYGAELFCWEIFSHEYYLGQYREDAQHRQIVKQHHPHVECQPAICCIYFYNINIQRTLVGTHEILATVALSRLRFIFPQIASKNAVQTGEHPKLELKRQGL